MKLKFLKINNIRAVKKSLNTITSDKGFTIVEIMIYFTMTSIILTFLVLISMNLMDSREKINAHHEVGVNGRYIMEIITREINNAIEVSFPVVGNSDNTLSLNVLQNDSEFPELVNFYLDNGNLHLSATQDGPVHKLNTAIVKVKSLEFIRINEYLVTVSFIVGYDGYNKTGKAVEEYFRTSINTNFVIN